MPFPSLRVVVAGGLTLWSVLAGIDTNGQENRPPLAVPSRTSESRRLVELRELAALGDSDAQTTLGVMYHNGTEVPQDYTEAAKWLRLAAEQGNDRAQRNFSRLFEFGHGVPQDFVTAHMWGVLSGATITIIDHERFSPERIAEAKRRAREWKPTPLTPEQQTALRIYRLTKDLSGSPATRATAARTLSGLGSASQPAIPGIVKLLGDFGNIRESYGPGISAPGKVTDHAEQALKKLGPLAVEALLTTPLRYETGPPLQKMLVEQAWVRTLQLILATCWQQQPIECESTVFARVKEFAFSNATGPVAHRWKAANALSMTFPFTSSEREATALADMVSDADGEIRWVAVQALAQRRAEIGASRAGQVEARVADSLRSALAHRDQRVRVFAYDTLLKNDVYATGVREACKDIRSTPCSYR